MKKLQDAIEIAGEAIMGKNAEKEEKRFSRIQPSLTKLFDCPVCFERIKPPVTVCVNGHAVCQSCKKQLYTCPTCKASFSMNKNTMLDQIIEENIFSCKYSERGCVVEMKFREVEEHEQKYCKYRPIICAIVRETENSTREPCNSEMSICHYYHHVNHHHSEEPLQFSLENQRIIDISKNLKTINILKDIASSAIVFETIKLNREEKKFYITYQFIDNSEEANKYTYELRIYNEKEKYKELRFKNVCVPLGMSEEEMEESDRCLVLNTSVLKSFRDDDRLVYSVKIDPISLKWYRIIKKKWKALCYRQRTPAVQ